MPPCRTQDAEPQRSGLVLGVDGGGTSTEFVACRVSFQADGACRREVVARARTGSTSPKAVGVEAARRNLESGILAIIERSAPQAATERNAPQNSTEFSATRTASKHDAPRTDTERSNGNDELNSGCEKALQSRGRGESHNEAEQRNFPSFAVFGMSGLDSPADERFFRSTIEASGFRPGSYALCSDAVLPLFACGHDAGVAVVCGTGSIALGLAPDGTLVRVGGWGYGYSDLGSGQWVGAQALSHALTLHDAGKPPDELARAVLKEAGVGGLDELAAWAIGLPGLAPTTQLAPAVLRCTASEAAAIIDRAAREIALLATNACRQLAPRFPENREIPIVLAGGMFSAERFQQLAIDALPNDGALSSGDRRMKVSVEIFDRSPVEGAIELATRIFFGNDAPPPALPAELPA